MKKKKRNIIIFIIIVVSFIWINNSNLFIKEINKHKLLAHRGLAQTFDVSKVKWDTDTSKIIYTPEHPYLENTIESMKAAFSNNADVVELDVKLTKDNKLAVFHDFELGYRTDGKGEVSDYTMEELKKLDIGYGYTSDNGKTYPFRGKGIGMMPSLEEVFEEFPDKELLIHIKIDDVKAGEVLWTYLKDMSKERLSQITIYGDDAPIKYLKEQNNNIRAMSKETMIKGLVSYELLGWTGYIPKGIRNTELHLPLNYAKFLWGWPNKFIQRMESVNTRVVVVNGSGGFSEGFDDEESLNNLPESFSGYIWTNRIDKISKVYKNR